MTEATNEQIVAQLASQLAIRMQPLQQNATTLSQRAALSERLDANEVDVELHAAAAVAGDADDDTNNDSRRHMRRLVIDDVQRRCTALYGPLQEVEDAHVRVSVE